MTIYNHDKPGLILSTATCVALLLGACQTDDSSNANPANSGETETGDGDGDGDASDGGHSTGRPSDDDDGEGDGDRDPTGDGDGEPERAGDGDGDGDDDNDGDGDGDGDVNDEVFPMPGDDCEPDQGLWACIPSLDGAIGQPLRCNFGNRKWTPTDSFDQQCLDQCETEPLDACAGVGTPAVCVCELGGRRTCDEVELGCTAADELTLCHGNEVVRATCRNCRETVSGYYNCDE